jgi:cyclophilin family peptidyl-prolyl cis-trans isomerase
MKRNSMLLGLIFGAFTLSATAQNVPPVVANPVPDSTEYAGAPAKSIDLTKVFSDPDVSNAVRMVTVMGTIDVALFGQQKPITVTNFLKYVNEGRYFKFDPTTNQVASTFFHRATTTPQAVIQAGQYIGTVDPNPTTNPDKDNVLPTRVFEDPPIQNEPGTFLNKRGTIGAAKLPNDPNGATSQFYFNVNDNPNLDNPTNNGGYTVFGRVVNNGLTAIDQIYALPRYDASGGNPASPFYSVPLRNFSGNMAKVQNLVSIPSIAEIPPMNFSATSDTTNVSVLVSGGKLLVTGNTVGAAHITVTATDFDGATVSTSFNVNVVAAPGRLVNLSTRVPVGTGDDALIAGFIVRGADAKRVAVRGLGPSLTALGVPNALANPTIELHDSTGAVIGANDDWGNAANKQDLSDVGLAPTSAQESAFVTTVPSNTSGVTYTVVLRGVNNTTGIGVVEVYDLDSGPGSTLLNVSTRGDVSADPNVLIGGFTLGGTESKKIVVRAIGPSLTQFGVPNALQNPTLELRNGQGALIDSNDDWMNSPQHAEIQSSGLAPTNNSESAVLQILPTGQYTAIVRGANGGTGVGAVQVYQLP